MTMMTSEFGSGLSARIDLCNSMSDEAAMCFVCHEQRNSDDTQWLACGHWLHQACAAECTVMYA